jgi:phosphonopyruvate decarboxylase
VSPARGIQIADALRVVHATRRDDDVVITTMSPAREWMAMGPAHPLDLVFVPSAMSHATSVGLGIALAQPQRRVIVCNGDGSMLMNLGSLVSITAAGAHNLVVIVFDNQVYEVTGAQPTAGSAAARADGVAVDFEGMARASGFRVVRRFRELGAWKREGPALLTAEGPLFILVDVMATVGAPGPKSPGKAGDRAAAFMTALRVPTAAVE